MKTTYKKIETISEFIDAVRIRVDVFIKEQGFYEKCGFVPIAKPADHFGILHVNMEFRKINNPLT